MPTLIEQLTEAATDLYYPSESDYPLEPFIWKREEVKTSKEVKTEESFSKEIEPIEEPTPRKKQSKKKKREKADTGKEKVSGESDSVIETVQKQNNDLPAPSSSTTTVTPSPDDVLKNANHETDTKIEEITVEKFFDRVTKTEDWYGDEENSIVEKFLNLRKLVETNLKNVKVFRLGEIEIDVYLVGVDAEGKFIGLKTTVVET